MLRSSLPTVPDFESTSPIDGFVHVPVCICRNGMRSLGETIWIERQFESWSSIRTIARVIELLDDLRDRIWAHYEFALLTTFSEERVIHYDVQTTDPPF